MRAMKSCGSIAMSFVRAAELVLMTSLQCSIAQTAFMPPWRAASDEYPDRADDVIGILTRVPGRNGSEPNRVGGPRACPEVQQRAVKGVKPMGAFMHGRRVE